MSRDLSFIQYAKEGLRKILSGRYEELLVCVKWRISENPMDSSGRSERESLGETFFTVSQVKSLK